MFEVLRRLFGFGPKLDFHKMVAEGALILDVRTVQEFNSGHIQGAKNIPVDQLSKQLNQLKDKEQVILCCCASGMRSGAAKRLLTEKGYQHVYNGGPWTSLQKRI